MTKHDTEPTEADPVPDDDELDLRQNRDTEIDLRNPTDSTDPDEIETVEADDTPAGTDRPAADEAESAPTELGPVAGQESGDPDAEEGVDNDMDRLDAERVDDDVERAAAGSAGHGSGPTDARAEPGGDDPRPDTPDARGSAEPGDAETVQVEMEAVAVETEPVEPEPVAVDAELAESDALHAEPLPADTADETAGTTDETDVGEPEPVTASTGPVATADQTDVGEPEPVVGEAGAVAAEPVGAGEPRAEAEQPEPVVAAAELAEPDPVAAAVVAAETAPVLEDVEPGPAEPADADHEDDLAGPLVADADALRDRWTAVQTGFVDAPREAVQGADQLVEEVVDTVTRALGTRREALLGQWEGTDTPTDELLEVFRDYRSLFDRLLSL